MLNCIIVDDEKIILDELCVRVTQADVEIKGAYQDPEEALREVENIKPDVAFLDIEMPVLNGIELAKKITVISAETQIVFVTAYEQYALKAFEVFAVDYLLKPITQEKINEAVNRVLRIRQMNVQISDIGKPAFVNSKMGVKDRISVKDKDDIIIIKIRDIIYLKSEEGKTIIVTKDGIYSSRTILQYWEKKFKKLDFIRCHRGYLVNANYITKMIHVLGDYKELVLDYCDVNVPISRQKIGAVKEWMGIL